MIKILQVLGTVDLGGAESRVMDLYRHMDRDKICFDFLVTEGTGDYYKKEIESLGGRVYYLPAFRIVNILSYRQACAEFFKSHMKDGKSEYSAVHGHMTSTASIYLPIARKYGVPLLIAHARSAGTDPGLKGMATRLLRKNLYRHCDVMLACSDMAGDSVFGTGRDYVFMPNAIDTKEFSYDEDARKRIRGEYGIGDDKILIGHVGSFRYAKNHAFIIEVFKLLSQDSDRYRLMLVGDGTLRAEIEAKVAALGLADKVISTGNQSPVAPYYQAFDLLFFPSHYEGMPGTVAEAQAAGLKCLISDAITDQVVFTDNVTMMSLDESASVWANKIKRLAENGSDADLRKVVKTLSGKPLDETLYDVGMQVEYYGKLYTKAGGEG